jgi:hypothetical protein
LEKLAEVETLDIHWIPAFGTSVRDFKSVLDDNGLKLRAIILILIR